MSGFTACSLAIFDPQNVAAVFRSTVPGKQRAQVGRWRPVGQRKELDEDQKGWWQRGNVKIGTTSGIPALRFRCCRKD
jgi:hypothetical protein